MTLILQALAVIGLAVAYYYLFVRDNAYTDQRGILSDKIDDVYDYVIVGGGSAGAVLASRLSEDKNVKILLVEAGGFYDEHPLFHIPIAWVLLQNTYYDWGYYSVPQNVSCLSLKEQKSFWPRGRVLGGSSVLNAMQYTRGSRYEYDEWSCHGCTGWSYKDVLPYFLKSEDILIDDLKSSEYRHSGGPFAVSDGQVTELSDLYMKAGQEMGYNIVDYNGADQEGFSRIQLNVRDGVRESTGIAFLGRIGKRTNLDIVINTFVTKIEIQGATAKGVYYVRNGRKTFVRTRKEVILSAGAINSPQLLMLSGIGPKDHLKDLGIPVMVDLPVGNNLQDHLMLALFSKINRPISLTDSIVNGIWMRLRYTLFGTGPLSITGSEVAGFFYTDENKRGKTYADLQFTAFSKFADKNFFNFEDDDAKEFLAENGNVEGLNFIVYITHPKSRGTIRLQSADPFDYPLIDPQYLTDKRDVKQFMWGIRFAEKLLQSKTMKELGTDLNQMKLSFCSKHEFRSDA